MAVVESAGGSVDLGAKVGSAGGRNLEPLSADSSPESGVANKDADRQQTSPVLSPTMQQQSPVAVARLADAGVPNGAAVQGTHFDRSAFRAKVQQHQLQGRGRVSAGRRRRGRGCRGGDVNVMASAAQPSNGEGVGRDAEGDGEDFRRDIKDLEELLSKLNPMAEEFVPSSLVSHQGSDGGDSGVGGGEYVDDLGTQHHTLGNGNGNANGHGGRRKNSNFGQGKRRMNTRSTSMAQREEVIRRTVYVSDIDQQVTEEQLAALFINCGQVVDCRVCGDPNSVLRFAFIEFTDEDSARAALSLSGTMLGYYPVRVLPSKTAIAPVNPTFLPRSEVEREMCARTIYCTNIDKRVSQASVKLFFESICGEVYRLRLLGDYHHSTRIAFVEFVMREEELLSYWWKDYAECSQGPKSSRLTSDVASDADSNELYVVDEERVGVPVKGGLYEVDLVKRHCFPVYWHGENRHVLRGHWFARKGSLDWLPLREDIAEQLEIAYHRQVWHRRTFQPSGLFAARIDIQGTTEGLHALFTGEDDTWEAWLGVDSSGFSGVGRGNGVKVRRGYSSSGSLKPTQV